jgi:predicted AAA+ superfamily ATPase
MGAVLETYVVAALDAQYYFREGKREIDIILKNNNLLPVEVKQTVTEADYAKFSKLLKYIHAKRGIIVSSNQKNKREKTEVIPAYAAESLLEQ